MKLEVVGGLYIKEIITSRRILLERNCNFPRDSLCDKETTSYKKVKIITNLIEGFFALFQRCLHI
jgi:hypothetical protein